MSASIYSLKVGDRISTKLDGAFPHMRRYEGTIKCIHSTSDAFTACIERDDKWKGIGCGGAFVIYIDEGTAKYITVLSGPKEFDDAKRRDNGTLSDQLIDWHLAREVRV